MATTAYPKHETADAECEDCIAVPTMVELQKKIADLEKQYAERVADLEKQNAERDKKLADLEKQNADLEKQIADRKKQIADRKKQNAELAKHLRLVTSAKQGGIHHLFQSVSVLAAEKCQDFREILPATLYPGAFVAHEFYISFVKAARRMARIVEGDSSRTRNPTDDDWNCAISKVTEYGTAISRQEQSLFPMESQLADLEQPQSVIATELTRIAIDYLQSKSSDQRIFVSHQFSVKDNVEASDTDLVFKKDGKCHDLTKATTVDFKVDMLIWVVHKDSTMGCTAIAATEYKPDGRSDDNRKAQADIYGLNIMYLHKKMCIAVDIDGGKNWAEWKVCASAILPFSLGYYSGANKRDKQCYTKSTLFEGVGAEGIVGLAAGVIKAVDSMSDIANDFGTLLGPVVGLSHKTKKVTKAYDGATYRRPNIDIVRELVDENASIFESKDKNLQLVETTYFATDWTEPVPLRVFAAILRQLHWLHDIKKVTHGDIRLANMLRKKTEKEEDTGCLTDFDFCGCKHYPRGLQSLTEDGARFGEVEQAIKANQPETMTIEKKHDYYSMKAVMQLFEAPSCPSVSEQWNECKELTGNGKLEEAAEILEADANNGCCVDLSDSIAARM